MLGENVLYFHKITYETLEPTEKNVGSDLRI